MRLLGQNHLPSQILLIPSPLEKFNSDQPQRRSIKLSIALRYQAAHRQDHADQFKDFVLRSAA